MMTPADDLAAEGDRLHACGQWAKFAQWANSNWVAIRAALRERDEWQIPGNHAGCNDRLRAERVRAETAEADADRLASAIYQHGTLMDDTCHLALAAHAAAVEARP